jgi:DNA segregation ATPase FtsK/SpoIIIE, S-DNA-T family
MLNFDFLNNVKNSFTDFISGTHTWNLPNVDELPDAPANEVDKETNYRVPVETSKFEEVLKRYGIDAEFKDYHIGSSVTTYEIIVPMGTKVSSLIRSREDIARDIGAPSLRIIQSINNSSTIGFEVENIDRYIVHFKDMFRDIPDNLKLPVILGEDTYGEKVYVDLTTMPHLLVAGRTGSGKSVFINTLITTLICKFTPEQLQLILVDPKQVEFAAYENLPHLFKDNGEPLKIASDATEAHEVLEVAVEEMERRFELMKAVKAKKINDYNVGAKEKLPYIVFIIDEFADLMLMSGGTERKDVENKIVRIAQKARAVGIHMILSTQKPLAQIMTTLIKANMPARISFSVSSAGDSRVILDEGGAEALTGNGDMLYRDPFARSEYTRIKRIQAPWISDPDIERLINQGK